MSATALQALLERVEAGEFPADISAHDLGIESNGLPIIKTMYSAYHGSLDAAKALHDALLGKRFAWIIANEDNENKVRVYFGFGGVIGKNEFHGKSPTISRSWLIAILRALISEAE